MKIRNLALLSVMVTTLVACGGGGGDTPVASAPPMAAGPADKYVGAWGACQNITGGTNGAVSVRIDFVFTKIAPSGMSFSLNGMGFTSPNCGGGVVNPIDGLATGTMVLNGTKSIGVDVVDRLDVVGTSTTNPELNGPAKDLALVAGNTLRFGGASAVDAQGYPTALDNAVVFYKQ